jgi:hypothetical protein
MVACCVVAAVCAVSCVTPLTVTECVFELRESLQFHGYRALIPENDRPSATVNGRERQHKEGQQEICESLKIINEAFRKPPEQVTLLIY